MNDGAPPVVIVRVELPSHLRRLAGTGSLVEVRVDGDDVTARTLFDALESAYPTLRGTIRDPRSGARRAYMRWFAGTEDLSHTAVDEPLPDAVVEGREPLRVVGAIAGG